MSPRAGGICGNHATMQRGLRMRKALDSIISISGQSSTLAIVGIPCMFIGLAIVATMGRASANEPGQALPDNRCEIHSRADDGSVKIVAMARTCEDAAAAIPLTSPYRLNAMYAVKFGAEDDAQ